MGIQKSIGSFLSKTSLSSLERPEFIDRIYWHSLLREPAVLSGSEVKSGVSGLSHSLSLPIDELSIFSSASELEEAPNSLKKQANAAALPAAVLPDLVFDNVEIEGDRIDNGDEYGPNFQPGDEIRLDWAVDNIGSGDAGASRVAIWLRSPFDGIRVDTNSSDAIDAGDSDTGQFDSFTLPSTLSAGLYTIELIADDQNVVSESNESNNSYKIVIRVDAAGKPDLVLDNVEIQGDSVGNGDEYLPSFRAGDEIRLDWDVDNRGNGSAGESRVAIWLRSPVDGIRVDTNSTDSIVAGGSDTGQFDSFVLPSTLSPGLYTIEIIADDENAIGESNENNNSHKILIRVEAAPSAVDEIREGTDTTKALPLDEVRSGTIDAEPITGDGTVSDGQGGFVDKDWFKVTLERGHVYNFGGTSLSITTGSVAINLYDQNGAALRTAVEGASPSFTFDTSNQAGTSQIYYLAVSAGGASPAWKTATGDYALVVSDNGGPPPPPTSEDDFSDEPGDTTAPLKTLNLGEAINGIIGIEDADDNSGDKDVFAIHLTVGQVYDFHLRSALIEGAALPAVVFTIRDDDFGRLETSGSGSDEHEIYTAEYSGLHYIRVGSGGSSSDTGGYRLEVNQIQASQVPDDWADSPTDSGSPGPLSPSSSQTGVIETAGDKDYFAVTLVAGKIYHFSVESEVRPGAGAIGTLAMSLRGPNEFNTSYRGYDDGLGRAGFDFEVKQAGTYYVRIGAGGDSGDTGGYRVSVGAPRTPPPPPPPTVPPVPPNPTPTDYLLQAGAWANSLVVNFNTKSFDIYLNDGVWKTVAAIFKNIPDHYELVVLKNFVDKFTLLKLSIDFAKVADRISHADDWREALVVEVADWFVGALFHGGGTVIGAFVGAVAGATAGQGVLSGPLAGVGYQLGRLVGGEVGDLVYTTFYQSDVRQDADIAYDGVDDLSIPNSLHNLFLTYGRTLATQVTDPSQVADSSVISELDTFLVIDETWYLETYPDAAELIDAGLVSGVYAHFLTIGLGLGYQPNDHDVLSGADIAHGILNNDPTALQNYAIFAVPFGRLGGDGINLGELAVANLLKTSGPTMGASLDANLSALAHRKAVDLTINIPSDTIAAAVASNSNWAARWSNGADFEQLFVGELEALLGPEFSNSDYRLFVTASASGSAADVFSRLQSQTGWSVGGFDTYGIAEFGGLWVIIAADRAPGVGVVGPGADNLATTSIYGFGGPESLYAGLRAGRLFGLEGNDLLIGSTRNDLLDGGPGNDTLDGRTGADIMNGGLGHDTYYVDNLGDQILDGDVGNDHVYSSVSFTLGSNLDYLTLTGSIAINGTGNALNNILTGNAAANILDGGLGADAMNGGAGNDVYFVDNGSDRITENAGGGTDTVRSLISYVLGAELENLVLIGAAAINGTGNALANAITGNAAANRLDGGAGADTIAGGLGNDIYVVDNISDLLSDTGGTDTALASVSFTLAPTIDNLTLTGADAVNGTGNALWNIMIGNGAANMLDGGAGNDRLDGGLGADQLIGSAGHDTYFVDNLGDVVVDTGGGNDHVHSSVSYALGSTIEYLTLTGAASIDATGNALNNLLYGNMAANRIDGGLGADFMVGGGGDDTYVVDNASDRISEQVGGGTDTVRSSVGYALAAEVENLILTGTGAINGTGNAKDNVITGNAAANRLDGGAGADTMAGGLGNDVYVVDNGGDSVSEAAGGGADLVLSSVSFTLGDNMENLTLTGLGAVNGMGNTLANILTGNAAANSLDGGLGNDRLDGGAGADAMNGGAGHDTYFVDNIGDSIVDTGGGNDHVHSSISYTLGSTLEYLTLTGTAAINGTGNALNNLLYGNGAANTLDGGLGADSMVGGGGDDIYIVDNGSDRVTEQSGGGIDTVRSSVNHSLGAQVENLVLTGTGAINGTGNSLANVISGNSSHNILYGGLGTDTLSGGDGNDTYLYRSAGDSTAGQRDRINGFGAGDRINLSAIDANSGTGANNDAFAFIGASAFHNVAGELRASLSGGVWTIEADVNGDGMADLVIGLTTVGGYVIGASDFVL
ncbi:MAG TPA: CARDB domain-containing protein [Allosphingosinicella sp.]